MFPLYPPNDCNYQHKNSNQPNQIIKTGLLDFILTFILLAITCYALIIMIAKVTNRFIALTNLKVIAVAHAAAIRGDTISLPISTSTILIGVTLFEA